MVWIGIVVAKLSSKPLDGHPEVVRRADAVASPGLVEEGLGVECRVRPLSHAQEDAVFGWRQADRYPVPGHQVRLSIDDNAVTVDSSGSGVRWLPPPQEALDPVGTRRPGDISMLHRGCSPVPCAAIYFSDQLARA